MNSQPRSNASYAAKPTEAPGNRPHPPDGYLRHTRVEDGAFAPRNVVREVRQHHVALGRLDEGADAGGEHDVALAVGGEIVPLVALQLGPAGGVMGSRIFPTSTKPRGR